VVDRNPMELREIEEKEWQKYCETHGLAFALKEPWLNGFWTGYSVALAEGDEVYRRAKAKLIEEQNEGR
jgi:hypothetical protein